MKKISTLMFGLFIVMLSACGSSTPSEDVVKDSVAKMMTVAIHCPECPLEVVILDDYEITNSYTKEVNNETAYLFEFKLNLKVMGWDGSKVLKDEINNYGPMTGTVALVKRGNKWYSIK